MEQSRNTSRNVHKNNTYYLSSPKKFAFLPSNSTLVIWRRTLLQKIRASNSFQRWTPRFKHCSHTKNLIYWASKRSLNITSLNIAPPLLYYLVFLFSVIFLLSWHQPYFYLHFYSNLIYYSFINYLIPMLFSRSILIGTSVSSKKLGKLALLVFKRPTTVIKTNIQG